MTGKRAVVTGASTGIGWATVDLLRERGWEVLGVARRAERLDQLAAETGADVFAADLTDAEDVEALREHLADLGRLDVLVNNAGGARGLAPVAEADDEHWRWMYEVNVLGTMRVTRALLPALLASGDGHIVSMGSVAGYEVYDGGAGYTAAKHAQNALTRTLRLELLGQPVRVTEVCPGLVETEFSLVRFDGDTERARAVAAGLQPLVADDVADCVAWAVTRPSHVNIDRIDVKPRAQATATRIARS